MLPPFPAEIACIAMFPENKMEELIPNQLASTVASHPSIKELQKEGKLNSIEDLLKLRETVGIDALGWNKRPIQWTVIQHNLLNPKNNKNILTATKSKKIKGKEAIKNTSASQKQSFAPFSKGIQRRKIKGRVVSPFRTWQKPLLAPFYSEGTKIGRIPIQFRFQRKRIKSTEINLASSESASSTANKSDRKKSGKMPENQVKTVANQELVSLKGTHTKSENEKSPKKGKKGKATVATAAQAAESSRL